MSIAATNASLHSDDAHQSGGHDAHQQGRSVTHEYNHERPHEALGQKPPAAAYNPSKRTYPTTLPELVYPDDYELRRVSSNGMIGWRGKRAFVSAAIAHDVVGLKQVSDAAWEVYFGPLLLGTLSDTRPDLGIIRTPER